jgi:hypothetical protein
MALEHLLKWLLQKSEQAAPVVDDIAQQIQIC